MPITSVLVSDENGSPRKGGIPSKIWIPVLILGLLITAGALALFWNRWGSAWVRNRLWSTNTATSAPRELTAEELAGAINGTNPTSGAATNRTRRMRRTRRTPSQISTTSLPAYAKEPGEQELVIIRGPEGMEDAGMPPATVVMEPLSEDGEDSTHSRNNSYPSRYPPMPASPVNAPLLDQSDSSHELTAQPMRPPGDIMPRPSTDTLQSSEEGTSLAPIHDNRGEAPAYTETVDNLGPAMRIELRPSPVPVPPRRSGFRTLLHSIPNRFSMHGSSHIRDDSSSMASSVNPYGTRETSQSRVYHRPSNSGSGSLLTLTHIRNLSRQSNHDLNSPSLISLNSISAPLTHTLTRTEFTYPKSGPTPEQLRLISSPESFTRFAVPYGPDAIAYASRQDLNDVSPPDFDAPAYDSAGRPSRLRTSSSVADIVSLEEASASTPQQEAFIESILATDLPSPASSPLRGSVNPSFPQGHEPPRVDPLQIPLPSSPATSENGSQPQLEIEPLVLPKPSTIASEGPPTSYRAPSTLEDLPKSRNSSVASFGTAVDTIGRSPSRFSTFPSPGDNTEDEASTRTTPKIGRSHVLKPSDTAIKHAQSLTPVVATGSSH